MPERSSSRPPAEALSPPLRQIRAVFDARTVRVYQAFSPHIAEPALATQRFVAPFKRERMTWIKPSFLWMMYRAGWGRKPGQERILAIDILRSGFEQALGWSALSHYVPDLYGTHEAWQLAVKRAPVRIQWDPERGLSHQPLPYRSLQCGLRGPAVAAYVDEWIQRIEEVTPDAQRIEALVAESRTLAGDAKRETLADIDSLLPAELPYPLPPELAARIGAS
ncbi:MAG: DUF4291 domain-containing protein [Polyangiaceae bacterium]|nr:DUF4291 domain-containing protein [Polyangiaceae bacterium]